MKTKKIVSFILLFILILSLPYNNVKAAQDLTITEWVIDAQLLETGDLKIAEDITFKFNDSFNGVFREIVLNKTSGVSDIRVQQIVEDTFDDYVRVQHAEKGDSGVFLVRQEGEKIIIQIFSPSEHEKKTFRISYVVKNVAVKYNDIGELYYKFLGNENKTPIDSFIVNIKLPRADAGDQIRIFAHGPLNGEVGKQNDTSYFLRVDNVPSDTFIEGRILFPKDYISLSDNIRNIDNYSNILEQEAAYQNKLIEDRNKKQAITTVLGQASILVSAVGFVLFIIFIILFRREKDLYSTQEYNGIPEDCTPAVACYLTGNIITTNTIFATILDLFRKGYIAIDKHEEKSANQHFVLTRIKNNDNLLLSHEKYFINWMIDEVGNGKSVSTHDIEQFGKHNNIKFINLYSRWKRKIKEDAIKRGYYDKSKVKFGIFFLIFSVGAFVLSILTLAYQSLFGIPTLIISILLFIYSMTLFYRRSDYGQQQYRKWIHFIKEMKRYKMHLSKENINVRSLDISLIYALALNVVKKADDFNLDKANIYSNGFYHNNSWLFWYFIFINNENNAFEKSINSSLGSNLSGSGGFTGGGGGGAGGGGAGGF